MAAQEDVNGNRRAGSGLRGRCAECLILAWTVGLLSAFFGAPAFVSLIPAGAAVLLFAVKPLRKHRLPLLLICLGLAGGVLHWHCYDRFVKQPLCALDGMTETCTGTVTEREQLAGERAKYTLRMKLRGHRTEIEWYAGSDVPPLRIGDRVTLSAAFTRIRADYRFHTQSYQAGLGRYLRIYDADVLETRADKSFSLRRTLQDYRAYITEILRTRLPAEDAALLESMLFGDTSFLSDEARSALYHTGIGHITAVSGLHLIFFGAMIMRLLKRLRCSARQIFAGTALTVLLFALTVDASVSVQRAGLMLLLSLGAGLVGRYGDALRSLCLAMCACLICTPYVIGSVSFWLSVSGTFGIAVAAPYMTDGIKAPKLLRNLAELCTVAVSVFPASVLLCGETSLLSPLCNLLIVPLAMCALYLGLITVLTGGLTAFLLPLAGLLCRAVLTVAEFAAKLPFSHLTVSAASVRVTVAAGAVLLLLMLALKASPRKTAAAVICMAVLLSGAAAAERIRAYRELRIAVVGGEKHAEVLISCGGHTAAADLSDSVHDPQYLRRYLSDTGLTHLDALVLHSPRNAAAHQAQLSAVTVGSVYVQSGTAWRGDAEICGRAAEFLEGDTPRMETGTFRIVLEGDVLTVTLPECGITAVILPADAPAQEADAVIRWGGASDADDKAAIRCITAEEGGSILLRITADGRAELSPLG